MSRISPPAEKIIAVTGTYKALSQELAGEIDQMDVRVQVQMLITATAIAMGTDTRDMGILALQNPLRRQGVPDAGE